MIAELIEYQLILFQLLHALPCHKTQRCYVRLRMAPISHLSRLTGTHGYEIDEELPVGLIVCLFKLLKEGL
jgi:hypothetical protein